MADGVRLMVGVEVTVGDNVAVDVPVRVGVFVGVPVHVGVAVEVALRVAVGVRVGVRVGVAVPLRVGVRVAVRDGVSVIVAVWVRVGVAVALRDAVRVGLTVGVWGTPLMLKMKLPDAPPAPSTLTITVCPTDKPVRTYEAGIPGATLSLQASSSPEHVPRRTDRIVSNPEPSVLNS